MKNVYAEIELINGDDMVLFRRDICKSKEVRRVSVIALVDTTFHTLIITEKIKKELDLPVLKKGKMD